MYIDKYCLVLGPNIGGFDGQQQVFNRRKIRYSPAPLMQATQIEDL